MRYIVLGFIFCIITIGVTSAATIGVGNGKGVIIPSPTPACLCSGVNSTFNQSAADLLYWRLDGSNDPPTASWNMGQHAFYNVSNISFNSDPDMNTFLLDQMGNDLFLDSILNGIFNIVSNVIVEQKNHNVDAFTIKDSSGTTIGNLFNVVLGEDSVFSINRFGNVIALYNITAKNVFANNLCYSNGTNCITSVGNSTFNQSLTDRLYAPKKWDYNQTYTSITEWMVSNSAAASTDRFMGIGGTIMAADVGINPQANGSILYMRGSGGSTGCVAPPATWQVQLRVDGVMVMIADRSAAAANAKSMFANETTRGVINFTRGSNITVMSDSLTGTCLFSDFAQIGYVYN